MTMLLLRPRHLLALLAAPSLAQATTYRWPDVAPPCNTATLQACIYAVNSADTVLVQTDGPIDLGGSQYLYVNKPLSLLAAPGFRPTLPPVASISVYADPGVGVNWNAVVEGFTVPDGAVIVQAASGNATVSLRRLDVTTRTAVSNIGSGLALRNNGSGTMTYEVAENRVLVAITDVSQPPGVYLDSNGGGTLNGRVHDNRLRGSGVQPMRGIVVYPQGASTTRVYANQIGGNVGTGITIFPGNAAFAHQFDAVGNAVDCNGSPGFPTGISPVRSVDGSLALQVFNNTVVGCYSGLSVGNAGSPGPLSGRIANNLIAYNNYGLALGGIEALVSNDHNLLFANPNNNYTPGPGTVTSDPLLRRGKYDARLTTGSHAIDAADSTALRNLLAAAGIGEIDADGSRRFKGASSLSDIGAFEFGDVSLGQRVNSGNTSGFVSTIDNAALNSQALLRPLLTATRTVESYQALTNEHYTGVEYNAPYFRVRNEDSNSFTLGSAYNVFAPGAGAGVLLHASNVGNVFGFGTQINDAYLNNQPNRIVLATHRPGSTFNHPLAASYFGGFGGGGSWFLWQGDAVTGDSFPVTMNFHVYAQDPSLNAFRVAKADGIHPGVPLDQVAINGEPCAQIYATPGYGAGGFPHKVQLRYRSALRRWFIEATDGAIPPFGTDYNVVVDEAATVACRYEHIFHDEFEVRD